LTLNNLFINYFTNLYFNLFIIFIFTFVFIYILYIYSDLIESFVIYHHKKLFINTIISKFRLAFILSLPFMIVLNNVFAESFYYHEYYYEFNDFIISLIISINLLLILQLLSNPSKKVFLLRKIKKVAIDNKLNWSDKNEVKLFFEDDHIINICINHKKRIINFFYVLLYGTLFYIYLQIIYLIIFASPYWITFIGYINILYLFFYFNIYVASLFILILFSEIIISKLDPIIIED